MKQVFEHEATIAQWDDDYYTPVSLWLYDRAVADMLQLMQVRPGSTVLDAGCGPGVHSIRVARAGHQVLAIDISEAMLRTARERVDRAGLSDRVEFSQQNLTDLGFEDGSFEYAFSWGVLTHIPDAERALDELARVLRPGGRLTLYLTNQSACDYAVEGCARYALHKPLPLERRALGQGVWYEMNGEPLWVWRFDTSAVSRHLHRRGLRLVARRCGELSEIQRRCKGLPRRLLLHANNWAYWLRFPAACAVSNLLVYEKESGARS